MKIAVVLGTRPEIIKLSPIIRELKKQDIAHIVIHSNQHYSKEMDSVFFEELQLPPADFNLEVGSATHAVMTARILERIEPILLSQNPDWVVVQGDTNTVLGAALAASKLNIPVAHVEAGLRSYDRAMPEEINRIMVDHISSKLFCPTVQQQKILLDEGISEDSIEVSGNTIVEAIATNIELARQRAPVVSEKEYIVATLHRPSNVDDQHVLRETLQNLNAIAEESGYPVILPLHPRTESKMREYGLEKSSFAGIQCISPVGYLDMLQLLGNAQMVFTDSGGVQEEVCILGVPCVTIRSSTERPETIEVGANRLSEPSREALKTAFTQAMKSARNWENPFGEGDISARMIEALRKKQI